MVKEDTILQVENDSTLMPFLIQELKDKSRDNIKSLLRNKQVWIKGKAVSQFNHPLRTGEAVTIRWVRASDMPSDRYLNIVFEDDHIIVVDKKAGLLSVSDGNDHVTAYGVLTEWVQKQKPDNKVYIVHRLDQYTSGLLMFAKSEGVQNTFRNNWKSFISERMYIAVVEGQVKKAKGRISSFLSENKALVMISSQDPKQGKMAVTHYKTIRSSRDYSLLQVNLDTGKKNQIRVHMQDLGHSVAGDKKYGAKTNPIGRLCLHAALLALKHPITGELLRFDSRVPGDFLRLFSEKTGSPSF
jgi:23S rRNA pseudouridine1911/1915/1917 synthase